MKNYDTIAILKPDVSEEYVATLSKKLEKAVSTKPGQLIKKEDWGQKKLAYEIAKHKQGRYLVWTYFQNNKGPAAADKVLRFDENILRFVTYVQDENPLSPRAKAKAAKEDKKAAKTTWGDENNPRDIKLDFKNPVTLVRFITERGKIVPRRNSGADALTQRKIATAVKRARQIALLSYTEGFAIAGVAPALDVSGEV